MGINRLICPLGAGVASAIGMLGSPISFEFAQTNMARLDTVDWHEIATLADKLTSRGRELVINAGVSATDITVRYGAMMRYVGQGYEVETPIEEGAIRTGDSDVIKVAFEASYRQRFGRVEDMPPEVITWRVVVSGPRPPLMDTISGTDNTSCTFNVPQAKGSRAVWFGAESGFVETPVFNRYELQSMTKIDGPSIIEEVESTLILPPGFTAEVDNARNLIVSYG